MPDKLKRPPTKGTRHGNGAGYGGPAKGAGKGSPKRDFNTSTNAQGHNAATPLDQGNRAALRREQAEGLMDVLHGVATNEQHPHQVKAIETFQNRVWGLAKATVEATVKVNPDEMSDDQLLEIANKAAKAAR